MSLGSWGFIKIKKKHAHFVKDFLQIRALVPSALLADQIATSSQGKKASKSGSAGSSS